MNSLINSLLAITSCLRRRAWLTCSVLLLAGCAGTQTTNQSHVRIEIQDQVGFTITEELGVSGEARQEFQHAHRLFAQGLYPEGIELLERLVADEPELSAPRIDLAVAYHRDGRLEEATRHLETAIEQNPDHPIARNELGILYRKVGRFSDAKENYEAALAIYPGFHSARRNLAVLCDLYLGDLDCALRNYEAYMGTVDDDPEVTIWIADVRNRIGG